jgi:hypothetical protein
VSGPYGGVSTERNVGSTTIYDAMFGDLLEQVPDLLWPASVWTYSRMRFDPQLQAVLAAYSLPIRRASWNIDPRGARPEVAKVVATQLGLPLAGSDQLIGQSRIRFRSFMRLAMLHLVFGHMAFEKVYDVSDPSQAVLARVMERMPQTISDIRINFDTNELYEIRQWALVRGDGPVIPASALVWFDHDREGAAFQGRSVLRPAFGPWLIKHEIWRVHATSIRRFGMGIPAVTAPPGGTAAQVAEAGRLSGAMRAGDQAGMGLPNGFTGAILGMTGSVPDAMGFIEYLDQQMARMALAGFLDLSATRSGKGSYALVTGLIDLLMLTLQSIGDHMAECMTHDLAADIVRLNFGDTEPVPQIVIGDVGSRHEVTAEAIQALVACGALEPDPALDAHLRQLYTLPPRSIPWATPSAAPAGGGAPFPVAARARGERRGRDVRAATGLRRQPTTVEASAKTDFEQLQADWQDAVDKVVAAWQAKVGPTLAADLAGQVQAALENDDLAALGALEAKAPAGAKLLQDAMAKLAQDSADEIATEASDQGVDHDAPQVDTTRLAALGITVATLIAASTAGSAAKKALQLAGPDADPEIVAAAVEEYLNSLAGAVVQDYIGGAMSTAQNAGRTQYLASAPTATYYASEILDANTCEPCAEEDGHEFGSLDEAEAAYAAGGYSDCEGGLRCRGVIVAVWDDAASQAA